MLYKFIVCFIAGIGAGLGTGFAGMSAAAVISPVLITFLGMPAYQAVGVAVCQMIFHHFVNDALVGLNAKDAVLQLQGIRGCNRYMVFFCNHRNCFFNILVRRLRFLCVDHINIVISDDFPRISRHFIAIKYKNHRILFISLIVA